LNKFEKIASNLATILSMKNDAYGNAFDKTTQILTLLYPNGIKVDQFKDVHVIVRMLDKLSRIARDNDPTGESPYMDIAGYSILALARDEDYEN
jgi:ribonuclease HIII